MHSKAVRASANRQVLPKILNYAFSSRQSKVWLLLAAVIVCFRLGGNACTSEDRVNPQKLWHEYRASTADAKAHRRLLLGSLWHKFRDAPLWWTHQIDVMAGVADSSATEVLWPDSYRKHYDPGSPGPYRTSVACDVLEGGRLEIEVPRSPLKKSLLSLVIDDKIKWSTQLQSLNPQHGSDLLFLSGQWWHTAELKTGEKEVAVFLGCDSMIVAFLVRAADGTVINEVRISRHE